MEEVIRLFKQIQNTSSTKEKMRIISANKENELFKTCLKFLLDDNVVTGISSKKIRKKVKIDSVPRLYIADFSDVIYYLVQNNTGTDVDIFEMQFFLDCHEDDRDFYEQMITKSFRLGADAKLVNKCIPGLIPVFDVQLGTSIEKVKLKGSENIFISQKLNGCRCVYVDGKLMTRQGKEYTGLDHILKDIHKINEFDLVLDGELIYKNYEGLSDSDAFQKGTGIAMSKDADKTDLKYVLFDVLPLEEFMRGRSDATYSARKGVLEILQSKISINMIKNIEIVPFLYEGNDHSQIWKCLDYAESRDWEGVVVNLDAPYECKRTKNLIKAKRFFTVDIRCIGVEEGTGRNKGTLGAIVCEYKDDTVKVGSGFSDSDRRKFWEDPEEIIGKIVTVKYKEETKNKDGGVSIQFPVFETVRFDKDEPNYN